MASGEQLGPGGDTLGDDDILNELEKDFTDGQLPPFCRPPPQTFFEAVAEPAPMGMPMTPDTRSIKTKFDPDEPMTDYDSPDA